MLTFFHHIELARTTMNVAARNALIHTAQIALVIAAFGAAVTRLGSTAAPETEAALPVPAAIATYPAALPVTVLPEEVASGDDASADAIPRVVITAKRMTAAEKAAFDEQEQRYRMAMRDALPVMVHP
ncbi:hypothetical protein [Noviherbaspirillum galbum]|uniref:Uncharacterized protein n=1 Tax=Noviherbaspirillum galbum TaxID=2709383 RepID=A0A6B3SXA1_9BURK|nr:hypothetical protein [Noviherbaspirillum galbum]NEX64155.1 hypothetical protein [Noviherbaspirillum galbum]